MLLKLKLNTNEVGFKKKKNFFLMNYDEIY